MSDRRYRSIFLFLLLTLGALAFRPAVQAQDRAQVLGQTADLEVGISGKYEEGVADLAFDAFDVDGKDKGALSEIWCMDPFTLENITSFLSNLTASSKRLFGINLSPFPDGIAEIPHGSNKGKNFVLVPNPINQNEPNRIGIIDDLGNIAPNGDLRIVKGVAETASLRALDVHPTEEEIAVFDYYEPAFYFLDFNYQVTRGPFPVLGNPAYLKGGICYNTPDTVLVVSGFRNSFEVTLALEYNRQTGDYTGRAISLGEMGSDVIGVGIDTGRFGIQNQEALYVYNARNDALYALSLTYLDFPGPVSNLSCSRGATGADPLKLTWSNSPAFGYDSIIIFQNGVQVAALPGTATSFTPPPSYSGFSEFVVETRRGNVENEIRSHCVNRESGRPPWVQFDATYVPVSPQVIPRQLGLDCTSVVKNHNDFRLYLVGDYDNMLRVVGVVGQQLDQVDSEDVTLGPYARSESQNVRLTGVALTEVNGEPAFAAFDGDGINGDYAPAAGMYHRDGTPFIPNNPMVPIDFSPVGGSLGSVFLDWDADAQGRLITLDITTLARLVEIVYDPVANTFTATRAAPLPQKSLTPVQGRVSKIYGGITVLPNGMYLVSGDDTFDSELTRAFLMNSFDEGAQFIGYTQGLVAFSQFFSPRPLGIGIGAEFNLGLGSAYFEDEQVGVSFYSSGHALPVDASPFGFRGNLLVNMTLAAAHPDLKGEQLVETTQGLARKGEFETPFLRPGFAGRAEKLSFFYYVINPSDQLTSTFKVDVILDGKPMPALAETVTMPPLRNIYRALFDRGEKDFQLRITNQDDRFQEVKVIVGATGIPGAAPLFKRGDADGSGGVDISDPVAVLSSLYLGTGPLACEDAGDADDTGALDISDAIAMLTYQFLGGAIPLPGATDCGPDPTTDDTLAPCVPAPAACP
ncbi:MAG: hypothetical protein HY717_23735 [Planctomycetes bacterium]|nr:hypothetical protein [Planctomycetota bacterium]